LHINQLVKDRLECGEFSLEGEMEKNIMLDKINMVNGLIIECPLDVPKEDCPAKSLRSMKAEDRIKVLENMEKTGLDLIISHHRHCFQTRRMEHLYTQKELQFQ